MSYQNLKLTLSDCQQQIEAIIKEMGGKLSAEKKGNDITQFTIEIPGKNKALLNVYETSRGLNLNPNVGKEQPLSNLIAKRIAESYETVETKTHTFSSISKDIYDEFVNSFKNDYKILPHTDENIRIIIKLSAGKTDLTVTWFKTSHKLMIQGRTTPLWDDVLLWFADKIYQNPEEIIEIVFDSYDKFDRTHIKYQDSLLEQLLREKIGDIYGNQKIIKAFEVKWLKTSLFLLELNLELPEYYPAISSAIKVIEGILKRICIMKFGYSSFNRGNFDQFEENPAVSGTMKLKQCYASQLKNNDITKYIEDLYQFIRSKRHPYTHNPGLVPAELNKKESAEQIFEEVISLINKSENFERELF